VSFVDFVRVSLNGFSRPRNFSPLSHLSVAVGLVVLCAFTRCRFAVSHYRQFAGGLQCRTQLFLPSSVSLSV